ncbi:MAG: hypothetical protein AB7I50_14145 [Vicinamibacterales bacterium]
MDSAELSRYCREIEAHLCRTNGGHLIRLVGPAFELVRGWAESGVPVKIVFQGIDRYVRRSEEKHARRRPARIEFCAHDVRDAFDAWRRAVGVRGVAAAHVDEAAGEQGPEDSDSTRRGPSLPVHLQRVLTRLSSLLASERLPPAFLTELDTIVRRLDRLHEPARTARGDRRKHVLDELRTADRDLIQRAWRSQSANEIAALRKAAEHDLSAFRHRLQAEVWDQTVDAAAQRLLRERLGLPTLTLD